MKLLFSLFQDARQELESYLEDWTTTTPESYIEWYLQSWLENNSRKFDGTRIDVGVPYFEQRRLRENEEEGLRNFVLHICLDDGLSFYETYYKTLTKRSIYAISDGTGPEKDTLRIIICTKKDAIETGFDDIITVIKMFSRSRGQAN